MQTLNNLETNWFENHAESCFIMNMVIVTNVETMLVKLSENFMFCIYSNWGNCDWLKTDNMLDYNTVSNP